MFFTECARLAERHPDLAGVFERLDSQFKAMGAAEVIRSDDLASFLNMDPNQVRSALDMLTHERVLLRVEMIECRFCQMAALRSLYEQALDEDNEYRCTSCDHRLTHKTIQIITVYRCGEKWPEVSNLGDGSENPGLRESASDTSNITLDEQGWYTHVRLAEVFSVGGDALRKRLDRYRKHNFDGWEQNKDRRPREPRYLYQLQAVKTIVEELRASGQRPAK